VERASGGDVANPRIIVLLGPQGAGKGTQARLLSEMLHVPHISTGDLLREISSQDNPLGHRVAEKMKAGRFVSDEVLAEVVRTRTEREDCRNGYILDGYPRNIPQVECLEKLAKEQDKGILVINIDAPRDVLLHRLSGRLTCRNCGHVYNINSRPPKNDTVCDLDGGGLYQRNDDQPQSIAERLRLYDQNTVPLVEYYRATDRLVEVDGGREVEAVLDELRQIINK
jgi:adenylate kinase